MCCSHSSKGASLWCERRPQQLPALLLRLGVSCQLSASPEIIGNIIITTTTTLHVQDSETHIRHIYHLNSARNRRACALPADGSCLRLALPARTGADVAFRAATLPLSYVGSALLVLRPLPLKCLGHHQNWASTFL